MIVDLKGVIKKIYDVKQISPNLSVVDVVITVDDLSKSPQDIIATLKNEKIDLIKGFEKETRVIGRCFLNGREKDGKYFINLAMFDLVKHYQND